MDIPSSSRVLASLMTAALVAVVGEQPARPTARIGYSTAAFEQQRGLEQRFRAGVSVDHLSRFHASVTKRPHMAGSDGGAAVAAYLKQTLEDAGLDVHVSEYRAYLSLPREVSVDLVTPVREALSVTEPGSDLDPDTRHAELGPGFVAYSASGDQTAPVVYVNYGLPVDYAQLTARGIDVRGKIAIARYGRSHRAVKLHTRSTRLE